MKNLIITILGMSMFAFALVPLYNVFCDVTGLNGKMDLSVEVATPVLGVDRERAITVEFVVSNHNKMPWHFKPKHKVLTVHPGQIISTAYYVKNTTNHTMRMQAIPSMAPARASQYFKKVQCFCFSSQQFGPGESGYLTLKFYLDHDLPAEINRLTLAYTLFDITKEII